MKKAMVILFLLLGFLANAKDIEIIVIGNEKTKSEIIKRFFPNDKLQNNFEKTRREGKRKLLKTDWFERVDTYVVGENKNRLVIEVKEAYDKRFGGGPVYFSYGKLNYNGKGDSIFFDIGINKQSLGYTKYFITENTGYEFKFGNNPAVFYDDMDINKSTKYQKIRFKNDFNYRVNSEISLKTESEYYQIRDSKYEKEEEDFLLSGNINYEDKKGNIFTDIKYSNFFNEKINRLEIDIRKYFSLTKKLKLAIRNLYKIQDESKNKYYYLGIEKADEIRNNNIKNVIGNAAYLGNFELRLDVGKEKFGKIFDLSQLIIFLDYGRAEKKQSDLALNNGDLVYGFEYAVLIGSPVYMPIKFRVSLSDDFEKNVGIFLVESF